MRRPTSAALLLLFCVVAPRAGAGGPADGPADGPAEEPAEPEPEPAAEAPAEPKPRPAKKRGRASVPSWDEIMFGGGKGD